MRTREGILQTCQGTRPPDHALYIEMRMCPFDRLPVCPGHAMPSPHCTFSPFDRPSFDFAAPCVLCPSSFFSASKAKAAMHCSLPKPSLLSMQTRVYWWFIFHVEERRQRYCIHEPTNLLQYIWDKSIRVAFLLSATSGCAVFWDWTTESCNHMVLLLMQAHPPSRAANVKAS